MRMLSIAMSTELSAKICVMRFDILPQTGYNCAMKWLVLLLFSFAALPSIAEESLERALARINDKEQFASWLQELKDEAVASGISAHTVDMALSDIQPIEKLIRLDRKQPEGTLSLSQYLNRVVPQSRKDKAIAKYHEHKELLHRIGEEYGVQPRYIVALWGVETDFGRNMGGYDVPTALATLAYDTRRPTFFRKELLHALRIIDEGHIAAEDMKGSWAGAMGQSQFMPSSFNGYAVDGNGDGRRDIWGTQEDVFASIANYLAKHGWDDSATWGRPVSLPLFFDNDLIDRDKVKTISEWQALGVRSFYGKDLPNRALNASLVRPGDNSPVYMVYDNYKTLLKWNRSLYFATAVGLLSDALR